MSDQQRKADMNTRQYKHQIRKLAAACFGKGTKTKFKIRTNRATVEIIAPASVSGRNYDTECHYGRATLPELLDVVRRNLALPEQA